jgi:hypothetical protein
MAPFIISVVFLIFIIWLGYILVSKSGFLETNVGFLKKLSKEFKLPLETKNYDFFFVCNSNEKYVRRTLTGTIGDHQVILKELFYLQEGFPRMWYGVAMLLNVFSFFPLGKSRLKIYLNSDLEVIIDGTELRQTEPFKPLGSQSPIDLNVWIGFEGIREKLKKLQNE